MKCGRSHGRDSDNMRNFIRGMEPIVPPMNDRR